MYILSDISVISVVDIGPLYFQTYTETDTHENDAVLQKRPESYQNKVKHAVSVYVWKYRGPLTIRRITTKTPNIMKI
jgi:hypothetical protein